MRHSQAHSLFKALLIYRGSFYNPIAVTPMLPSMGERGGVGAPSHAEPARHGDSLREGHGYVPAGERHHGDQGLCSLLVKQVAVSPGRAVIHNTIPTPWNSSLERGDVAEVALTDRVSNTAGFGGRHRTRTYDPLRVKQVL